MITTHLPFQFPQFLILPGCKAEVSFFRTRNAETMEEKPDNRKKIKLLDLFGKLGNLLMFSSENFKKKHKHGHICWLMEKYGLQLLLLGRCKMSRQQKESKKITLLTPLKWISCNDFLEHLTAKKMTSVDFYNDSTLLSLHTNATLFICDFVASDLLWSNWAWFSKEIHKPWIRHLKGFLLELQLISPNPQQKFWFCTKSSPRTKKNWAK